jgi:tetratricopeptide (TPR) repeat protein/tRNA A-37 threonylcarbamoyl transferase component Bud32
MNSQAPGRSRQGSTLDEVLAEYLLAAESGEAPPRHELLARYPDLAQELEGFFQGRDRFNRLAAPLRVLGIGLDSARGDPAQTLDDTSRGRSERGLALPCSFGDYELLEELARGGMGVVYRARQKSANRLVAVKMIRAGALAAQEDVRRFRHEAETVANLDHPHIVPLYEVGEHDGQPYFSMKLVEGPSLAEQLPRYRADPRAAARLLVQIAQAVHHAHQRGVLHRDLKPSNILLSFSREPPARAGPALAGGSRLNEVLTPHVTDFGLAKRVETDSGLTHSGMLVGTPSYMAPEQASGRQQALTTAADVYGLGAILYALLTGRPPFQGRTVMETLERVRQHEAAPPSRGNPGVDRDLETICLKCLEKDPARRYASAEAVAEELERWLNGEPIGARRAGPRERLWKWLRRRPALAALIGLGTTAVVGLVGGILWHNAQLQAAATREHQQAEQTRRERDLAEEERRWVRRAADDLYTQVAEKWLAHQPHLEPVQREFLEQALQFYQHIAQRDDTDPSLPDATAQAHHRQGTIQLKLGQPVEAAGSFRRAITLFEKLAAEARGEVRFSWNLSRSYDGLGQALQAAEQEEGAARAYQQRLDRCRTLVAEFPARPEYQQDLANAQQNLAQVLAALGKVHDAEQAYHEARNILQQLVKEFPDRPATRLFLATLHSNLGRLLASTGRPREAEPIYRQAITALEQLARDQPATPEYRARWAHALINLAGALQPKRAREAVALVNQAAALLQRLADDSPAVPDYQWALACCHGNQGVLLRRLGEFAAAEVSYRQALATYRKLVARFPAVLDYRQNLGRDERNLGNLLADSLKRPKEAEEAYRRALGVQQQLVAGFPTVATYRSDLADSFDNLGAVLRRTRQLSETEAALSQALKLWEGLAAASPGDANYRSALARTCGNLAWVLVWLQSPPCPQAARAIALAKRAIALDPKAPNYWVVLGAAHYRAGSWNETLSVLQKCRELDASGDSAGWFAAMAAWQLGNKDEARKWYEQAVQWMDRNQPHDADLRRLRAEAAALLGVKEQPAATDK